MTEAPGVVLDASALLALLNEEEGAGEVERALAESICAMSAVNWAEVLTKLAEVGGAEGGATTAVPALIAELVSVESFGPEDAGRVAELRPATRAAGLSLGDRVCLAFAESLGWPAWTADRSWRDLDLGIEVHLLR